MGGDSFSFWRFDLWQLLKAFGVVLLLRGVTILLGFEQHVPILDDIINALLSVAKEIAAAVARFVGNRTSFN
jgi:hypothetical protein